MREIEALTVLLATPGIGSVKARLLLQTFGSALAVLQTEKACLGQITALYQPTINAWGWWKTDSSWETNLQLAEKRSVSLIAYTDPRYPQPLLEIADFPLLLYVKGELKPDDFQSIAVVGTRQPTIYGKEFGEKISQDLARNGWTVTSGLARGVDTAAHRGALKFGRTIAVIGSGLGNIYPHENHDLAEEIAEKGAVVSEFPMMAPPDKQNFPRRNRIVSGMTRGTLLIEAPKSSGAMITMRLANEQGRKTWAIPGRADTDHFRGNHQLIKTGQATLVEGAEEILTSFGKMFTLNEIKESTIGLDPEEDALLSAISEEELSIEEISLRTKLPVMKLNILLMSLMMKRRIKEYPGKIYRKQS